MIGTEAAASLGCPVGTVRGRLSRARDMLRGRLERAGLGIRSVALVAELVGRRHGRAEIPQVLREATLAAA